MLLENVIDNWSQGRVANVNDYLDRTKEFMVSIPELVEMYAFLPETSLAIARLKEYSLFSDKLLSDMFLVSAGEIPEMSEPMIQYEKKEVIDARKRFVYHVKQRSDPLFEGVPYDIEAVIEITNGKRSFCEMIRKVYIDIKVEDDLDNEKFNKIKKALSEFEKEGIALYQFNYGNGERGNIRMTMYPSGWHNNSIMTYRSLKNMRIYADIISAIIKGVNTRIPSAKELEETDQNCLLILPKNLSATLEEIINKTKYDKEAIILALEEKEQLERAYSGSQLTKEARRNIFDKERIIRIGIMKAIADYFGLNEARDILESCSAGDVSGAMVFRNARYYSLDIDPLIFFNSINWIPKELFEEYGFSVKTNGYGGLYQSIPCSPSSREKSQKRELDEDMHFVTSALPNFIPIMHQDAREVQFKDNSMDLCIGQGREVPELTIDEYARVTKPGGYIFYFGEDSTTEPWKEQSQVNIENLNGPNLRAIKVPAELDFSNLTYLTGGYWINIFQKKF